MGARSKWPLSRIGEVGRRALELGRQYERDLVERLAAGLLDGLAADLDAFEGRVSEARRAPAELRGLTLDQARAARAGHALVSAAREAVVRAGATGAQRKAFGVGTRAHGDSVPAILAALDSVIAGAARHPDLVRAAGMLVADLDTARALRAALSAADAAQETKKEARKTPVAQRTAVARRIEAAVDAIIAAGLLRFFGQPEIGRRFRALVPSRGRAAAGAARGARPTELPT